jgi:hypothetical protein
MKPGKSATRDYHPAKRRSPPLPCGGARGVAFGCGGRFATGSREISRPGPADGRSSAPAATEGRVSRSERGGARGVPPRFTSAPAATEGRVSRSERPAGRGEGKTRGRLELSRDAEDVELRLAGRAVRLTNLKKLFWPELGLTKRDLLQYYADVAPALLPHLKDRAMVMKRYPHGASGEFFFMKRAPTPRPDYLHFDLDPVRARISRK